MRYLSAGALLFGVLAGCARTPGTAPPPPSIAAEPAAPTPQSGAITAPAAEARGFDGHYIGIAAASARCLKELTLDFTVTNGQIAGTEGYTALLSRHHGGYRAVADLSGTVEPSGAAVMQVTLVGHRRAPSTLTGRFANGQFTGRGPCNRAITASLK